MKRLIAVFSISILVLMLPIQTVGQEPGQLPRLSDEELERMIVAAVAASYEWEDNGKGAWIWVLMLATRTSDDASRIQDEYLTDVLRDQDLEPIDVSLDAAHDGKDIEVAFLVSAPPDEPTFFALETAVAVVRIDALLLFAVTLGSPGALATAVPPIIDEVIRSIPLTRVTSPDQLLQMLPLDGDLPSTYTAGEPEQIYPKLV